MKKAILTTLVLLLFVSTVFGQFSYTAMGVRFLPFRSENYILDTIDLKRFTGVWKSLDGISDIRISQDGPEFLISGNYFPGVSRYGDKVKLSFKGKRLGFETGQGKFKEINTPQKSSTVGYEATLTLYYNISSARGGGGNSVAIGYSPQKDHLYIGTPPDSYYEKGQWVSSSGFSSDGIDGKEFKRLSVKTPTSDNSSIIDPLPDIKKIKLDLLNNRIDIIKNERYSWWRFDDLDEIKSFRIISTSSFNKYADYRISMNLGNKDSVAKYQVEVLVIYNLHKDEWDLQSVTTTMCKAIDVLKKGNVQKK
ncbi:MAG: hypothetical protein AB9833_06715 [Bacteroidales bacterium]